MADTQDTSLPPYDYRRIASAQRLVWKSFWACWLLFIPYGALFILAFFEILIPPIAFFIIVLLFCTTVSFLIGAVRLVQSLGCDNSIVVVGMIVIFGIVIPTIVH